MEFKPIKSSNLIEAAYDGADKLQIKFKNGTYEYENVKPEVYREFEKTFQTEDSSGKFFFKHIRPLKFKKL
jgi:hypothetical protein